MHLISDPPPPDRPHKQISPNTPFISTAAVFGASLLLPRDGHSHSLEPLKGYITITLHSSAPEIHDNYVVTLVCSSLTA